MKLEIEYLVIIGNYIYRTSDIEYEIISIDRFDSFNAAVSFMHDKLMEHPGWAGKIETSYREVQ